MNIRKRIVPGRRSLIVLAIALLAVIAAMGALGFFRPLSNPPTIWTVRIGSHNNSRIEASVAVSNGLVYVAAMEPAPGRYPWGESHYLQALDAKTGAFVWHCEVAGYGARTPIVHGDSVYFVSVNSNLYALNARDGQVRWKFDGVGDEGSTPVANDYGVYVEIPGKTVAFHSDTGKVMWIDVISNPMTPLIDDDAVYPVDNGTLYAVDPRTGKQKWKFATDRNIVASPAEANDIIYLPIMTYPEGPQMIAIDRQTGRELWRVTLGEGDIGRIVVVDGVAYVHQEVMKGPEVGSDNYLTAIDLNTQKEKWRISIDYIQGMVTGKNAIYIATMNEVRSLNPSNGQEKWHFTASTTLEPPTLVNNTLYVGDQKGYLSAISVPDDERSK